MAIVRQPVLWRPARHRTARSFCFPSVALCHYLLLVSSAHCTSSSRRGLSLVEDASEHPLAGCRQYSTKAAGPSATHPCSSLAHLVLSLSLLACPLSSWPCSLGMHLFTSCQRKDHTVAPPISLTTYKNPPVVRTCTESGAFHLEHLSQRQFYIAADEHLDYLTTIQCPQ